MYGRGLSPLSRLVLQPAFPVPHKLLPVLGVEAHTVRLQTHTHPVPHRHRLTLTNIHTYCRQAGLCGELHNSTGSWVPGDFTWVRRKLYMCSHSPLTHTHTHTNMACWFFTSKIVDVFQCQYGRSKWRDNAGGVAVILCLDESGVCTLCMEACFRH